MKRIVGKKWFQLLIACYLSCLATGLNLRIASAMGIDDAGFVPDFGSFWRDPRYFIYQYIPSNVNWGTIAGWFVLVLVIILLAIFGIIAMMRKPDNPMPPPMPYYPPPMVNNPPPPPVAGTTLYVTHANGIRQPIPMIYDRMIIGRNPSCQIPVQDFKASDQHAEIFMQGGRYYVRDLGSTNGTFVNGYQVNGTVEIFSGSCVQIGDSTIQL